MRSRVEKESGPEVLLLWGQMWSLGFLGLTLSLLVNLKHNSGNSWREKKIEQPKWPVIKIQQDL